MQTFATGVITQAALDAGLPEGRVIDMVKKDNLTLQRPRIELQFLPEKYTRTGRVLGVRRTALQQERTRELYEVVQTVNANVLADDRPWLEAFSLAFAAALPRGGNDSRGNWVSVRAQQATFGRSPDKRVGHQVIEVFTRVNRLYLENNWQGGGSLDPDVHHQTETRIGVIYGDEKAERRTGP